MGVLSLLPARFLPRDPRGKSWISVGGRRVKQSAEDDLYQPVHEFLDRLLGRGATPLQEPLKAMEVGP